MQSVMKHVVLLITATLAIATTTRGTASAQILTTARCQNAFSVSSDTAQRRMSWGMYCRTHPGPDAGGAPRPATHYVNNESITDYNTADPTNLRPFLFPTYLDQAAFAVWDIPDTALTPGTQPPTAAPTNPGVCLVLPLQAVNVGLCVAGCYTEDMPLQFADGTMGIKAAALSSKADLVTLSPDATLDNLSTVNNKVDRYTTDVVESMQVIYSLTMQSGGRLRVTNEHPLLGPDGVIRQAQTLQVGDALVRADGTPDPIVDVQVEKVFGKVYNVQPITTDYASNIVIAGGYLNGSLRYQNEFLDTINSLILRRSIGEQAATLTN
jgi:hypothetical protein